MTIAIDSNLQKIGNFRASTDSAKALAYTPLKTLLCCCTAMNFSLVQIGYMFNNRTVY